MCAVALGPFVAGPGAQGFVAAVGERHQVVVGIAPQVALQQEAGEQQPVPLDVGGGLFQAIGALCAVRVAFVAQAAGVLAQAAAERTTGFVGWRGGIGHAQQAQCIGRADLRRVARVAHGAIESAALFAGKDRAWTWLRQIGIDD